MKDFINQLAVFVMLLCVTHTHSIFAQSWIGTPTLYAQLPGEDFNVNDFKFDNSGRVVMAGVRYYTPTGTFNYMPFVFRLNSDGSPDLSWGPNGIREFDLTNNFDMISGLVIQPDGKLLFCGYAGYAPVIARLNLDGTFDNSFGSGGKVIFSEYGGQFNELFLEPGTGKIVAGGYYSVSSNSTGLIAVRLTSNGQRDFSFNNDGVWTDFYWDDNLPGINGILQNADGSYWMSGYSNRDGNGSFNDAMLLKFSANGFLDPSFDNDGRWYSFASGEDTFNEIIRLSNGNLVMVGEIYSSPDHYVWVRMCDPLGNQLQSKAFSQLGDDNVAAVSVAQQCDGKIVVLANPEVNNTSLFRLNSTDLSIDPTFISNGFFNAQIGYSDNPGKIVFRNGELHIVGSSYQSSSNFNYYPFWGKLSIPITIAQPTISIASSNPNTTNVICPNTKKVLSATGNCSTCNVEWYLDNGATPIGTGITFEAQLPGNYTAKYINPGCGSSGPSNSIALSAGSTPSTPVISPLNSIVCQNSTLQLSASGSGNNVTYIWLPTGSGSGANLLVNTAINGTQSYTVYAQTNSGQCPSGNSNPASVTVVQPTTVAPIISPATQLTICEGQTATLSITNTIPPNHTILWSNGQTSQSISVNQSGIYSASFVRGVCSGPASTTVQVIKGATPPVPCITPSGNLSVCQFSTVQLNASCSGTGVNYIWQAPGAPNGNTYNVNTSNPGVQSYSVIAQSTVGLCPSQPSVPVIVTILETTNIAPSLNISDTFTICAGQSVNISVINNIPSNHTILWSNGSTSSSINVTQPGTYFAKFVRGTCNGPVSQKAIVVVRSAPTPTLSSFSNAICANGGSTTLTVSGCSTCNTDWYLNGQPYTSDESNMLQIGASGVWSAVYINEGCAGQPSNQLNIGTIPQPTVPNILPASNLSICTGQPLKIEANSNCSGCVYKIFKNGELVGNSPYNVPTNVSGTNTYQAISVQGGCESDLTQGILIDIIPTPVNQPVISPSGNISICPGTLQIFSILNPPSNTNTVKWFRQSDNTLVGVGNSINLSQAGIYYTTFASGDCVGPKSASVTLSFKPTNIPVISSNALTICSGNAVTLSSVGCSNCSTEWFRNNQFWGNGATIQVSDAGNYTAIYINDGCTGAESNTLAIDQAPPFDALLEVNSCEICAPTGSNFQWYLNNQLLNGFNQPCYKAQVPGNYFVQMKDEKGCPGTTPVVFAEPFLPTIEVNSGQLCAPAGGLNYVWYLNGFPLSGQNENCITNLVNTGLYSVSMTNAEGCTGNSSSVTNYSKHSIQEDINAAPNPTTGELQLEFPENFDTEAELRLTDNQQKVVYQAFINGNLKKQTVSFTNLPSGVYYLKIATSINIWTKKIVKI